MLLLPHVMAHSEATRKVTFFSKLLYNNNYYYYYYNNDNNNLYATVLVPMLIHGNDSFDDNVDGECVRACVRA